MPMQGPIRVYVDETLEVVWTTRQGHTVDIRHYTHAEPETGWPQPHEDETQLQVPASAVVKNSPGPHA